MMRALICGATSLAVLIAGCSKSDAPSSGGGGAGGGGGSNDKKAEVSLVTYNHTKPDFSLKVPSSCKAQPETEGGTQVTLRCDEGGAEEIEISWMAADIGKGEPKLEEDKIEIAKGDVPGGGKWLRYKDKSDNQGMEAIIKGSELEFRCWVWLLTDKPATLDSCKSFSASAGK